MMDDDQQFCLRWNNHQSTLISVFDTLLENGTLVDCTLAAEGQFLKAHKVVLSACSPYFANLLKEQYDKHPIFILKDVKYQELRAMMDYMYRGEVNISQDQLAALLKAAESLQIKGLSDNRSPTSGQQQHQQQQQQQQHQKSEQHQKLNVPGIKNNSGGGGGGGGSGGGGYTLEQTKRPRIGPTSIDSQDINREGSSSPTSRKRKKIRRRSVENVMDNHEHSNSSAHSIQQINSTAPMTSINTSGTSAVVSALQSSSNTQQTSVNISKKTESVLNIKQNIGGDIITTTGTTISAGNTNTGTTDDDNQNDNELMKPINKKEQNHKRKQQQQQQHEKDELLLEPKNEYDDVNETIEDLTEDPDDEDIMDEDIGQAGPSHHGGEGSSQGFPQWPADRSQDEFIMAAQDQGQQRDPQVKHDKSEQTDMTPEEFELDDCLLESNDIVITQNKDGFVLHVKKLGNITSSKQLTADEEQQQQQQQHEQEQQQHHHHQQQQQQQQQHHHHHHIATSAGVVAVPGGHHHLTAEDNQVKTLTNLHTIKLPSAECELINLKKIINQPSTSQHIHHHHQSGIATATIIQQPQQLQEHHQHTTSIVTNQQTINTLLGLREVNIQPKNIISGSRIKYSRGKYASPIHDSAGNTVQIVTATTVSGSGGVVEQHHHKQESNMGTTTTVMAGEKKFEIAEIDLNNPQASIISDLVKYAEIDDIELPDGTKIGIGFAPADITEHDIQTNQQQTQQIQIDEPNSPDESSERTQISGIGGNNSNIVVSGGQQQQEQTITKSYTILTTTPMKQTQQQQTTTTTTYELSLSDSSMTQSEDNEKLYMCRHCGKKYRWKSTLRRHENVECGGKEPCHPCPYCTYKAKQRGNLGVHVRKHHPEKPQLESKRGRKS